MATKKQPKKTHVIELESAYVGQVRYPVKFVGTQKQAEEFCKKHYNFYRSCKLNGVEQNDGSMDFSKQKNKNGN